jgi:hypothetical protein
MSFKFKELFSLSKAIVVLRECNFLLLKLAKLTLAKLALVKLAIGKLAQAKLTLAKIALN